MEGTLEKIGLSKDEVQVYSIIVQYGFRTIGQIQTYYKHPANIIQSALNSLAGKGYIREIKAKNQEGTSYFIPLPPQIKLTEDVSIRLETELKALSDDVKEDWNKTMNNFRSQLSAFHVNITENVDDHASEIASTATKFLDSITNVISSGKTETAEIIERLKSESSNISETNSDAIAKTAQRVKENVLSSFDSTIHKIGEHHDSFKVKIEERLGFLQKEHDDRTQIQLDALLEKVGGIKESLSVQLQEFIEAAAERKDVIITVTDETVKKISADSNVVVRDSSKKLSDTVNKIIANYEKKLDEYQVTVQQVLISLNDELKKLEDATTDRIRTSIDNSKETAVNILRGNENQFVDLLNKTKVDSVEKLGDLITQAEAKTEEMKVKLSNDLNSYLKEFKKNSDSLLSLLNSGIEIGFNLFEENLSSSIENVSNQIKLFVEDIMTAFRESTNAYLDKLSKTTAKYEKALKARKEKFATSHEEFKENFTSHINELKATVISNIEENVKDNNETIQNLITEKENKFKSDVEVFSDEFSKRGRDVRDEVPNVVQINYQASIERLQELDDQLKSSIAKIEVINQAFQGLDEKQLQKVFGKEEGPRMAQLIGSMNRDIELVKENVGNKMEEMIQTLTNSMNSLSNEIFEKMNIRLEDLARFTIDTLQKTSQSFDISRSEISSQFTASSDDMKRTIEETYTIYEEQFNELQGTSTKSLADVIGAESKAFSDITKSISGSLDELLQVPDSTEDNEGQTEIHLTIQDGLEALQTTKQEILDVMKKNNIEVTTNLQELLKTNIEDHSKLVTKATSSMDVTMKSLQSEFKSAKEALDTDISVTLDEAAKNYSAQTAKVETEINDLIEQEVQQFIEGTEGVLAELNVSPEKSSLLDEALATTKGELQKLGANYPKWVKTDSDAFATDLSSSIKEFQVGAQTEIDTMFTSVQRDLEKSYERMATDFVNNVTEIQNEFEKEKNDYELNMSHQVNSFITNSDSNSSALVTNIQGTKDALTEAITSGNDAVNADLSNLEKTLTDLFDSNLNSLTEKLNAAQEDSKIVNTEKDDYSSKLMSFKENIIKGTQQEIENVDTSISGTLSSIPNKIGGALDATGESMKLIKSVLSLGSGIEPNPIEDMWIVTGHEQVNGTMMSLLRNTKSSATVICPRLNWIDSEFIETFARKLEIVTNTTAHTDEDKVILSKMLGMGNVVVKDDSNLTVMMGTRDGIEEGFLGHKAPSGDPLLIVTFNEEIVGEITKIYYDYRSRAPIRQ